jgi:hypothetical protein
MTPSKCAGSTEAGRRYLPNHAAPLGVSRQVWIAPEGCVLCLSVHAPVRLCLFKCVRLLQTGYVLVSKQMGEGGRRTPRAPPLRRLRLDDAMLSRIRSMSSVPYVPRLPPGSSANRRLKRPDLHAPTHTHTQRVRQLWGVRLRAHATDRGALACPAAALLSAW